MPVPGKEIEHPLTPEMTAQSNEAVGYVEKIEKQVETQQPANIQPQQNTFEHKSEEKDMGKIVSEQFAVQTKPNIVLPMNSQEINNGLHKNIFESVRWLSEWCVMMIKKYPGRVFYLPPEAK